MRVRRRGFALILVLLAAAALFAVALQGAMLSRATTVESRVMVERARLERGARTAASMVLVGLGMTVERYSAQTTGSAAGRGTDARVPPVGGQSGGSGDSEAEERPRVELPKEIKELLGLTGEKIEDETKRAVSGLTPIEGGGITGRGGRVRSESRVSLPGLSDEAVVVRPGDGAESYVVRVRDASASMNINTAPREQLWRYFAAKGLQESEASAVAAQVLDWRDEDDFAEPGGAERSAYRERGVVCRNGPFKAVEEMRFLPAVTAEVFESVRDDLTVSGGPAVHVGTASHEVLLSLPGMDEEAVARLVAARRAGPIVKSELEKILPLYARKAIELLSTDSSAVLRVRVEVSGDSPVVFEGLAVMGTEGIRALGLRPAM